MKLEHFLALHTHTHIHTHKSQMIKDLNLKPENIKLLEETIGRTLSDINHSKVLYNPPPRVMKIKAKINKWGLVKLNTLAQSKKL